MKLPLKLGRSRSNSSASSSSSSPCDSPVRSPSSSQRKLRFPLPGLSSSKRTKPAAGPPEIAEASAASSPVRTSLSPLSGRGKVKAVPASSEQFCSAAASPASASSTSSAPEEGRLSEIEQVFAQFDANGDGKISTEELHAVLASLGDEMTREEAAQMVREVDADKDGFIDLKEFVEMNRQCQSAAVEEEMAAAFAVFDVDKKGRITAEGLQMVLQRLGGHLAQCASMDDCRQMIRGVDRKGVGHVDLDDFKRMMTPLIF
ncbi:hypothetical protein L7F22_034953 [Adiantum nelumboides]|nr:hypothetical protein [Adiantum nelumboides]